MIERLRRALPAAIGLVLFIAALEVLRSALRAVTWHDLNSDILRTPPLRLVLALVLTAVNYAVLTGYDFLALAYVGRRLPRWRVILTSFLAYAMSNNVGWAMLSGASVRYRFYSRFGVTVEELGRIVFSYSVTFWIGLLLLGGLSLLTSEMPAAVPFAQVLAMPLGGLLIAASLAYVVAAFVRRAPLRLRGFVVPMPPPGLAVAQLLVSVVDWILAGAVLYVLLAPGRVTFFGFLGAFLSAQILGLASHVPGGVGIFEGLMVLLLRPSVSSAELLPSLVVYRAVYYLLPLVAAVLVLVADEVHRRRAQASRITATLGRLTEELTARLLAAFTFISGAVLLFSGATPAAQGRLAVLNRIVPIGVIETSHFLGSLVGVALLVLSQGLARRLDAAYFLAVAAIGLGMAASLLKGVDYEEAAVLGFVLVLLWRARASFDRRAALFDTRFSAGWVAAIAGVLGASIWLGLFAFQHVEFSQELWWQFELHGEASRFLRASVGGAVLLALFAFTRLIGHAPHEADPAGDSELETAAAIINTQTATTPYLIYLRDKAVLFDEDRRGFVMYAVQGRTWVSLGDPVAPADRISPLIRGFLERCHDYGGTPVFYEIRKDHLFRYADFGLAFVKLGEDAVVDLRRFTLEGGGASKLRQVMRRVEKQDAAFRVLPPDEVRGAIEQLRQVSDEWLNMKSAGEKGFSLGFFDPDYLARFPAGVIEQHGRIVAFANLWPGPNHVELSVDLMRYREDAPKEVMEALFVHLLTWGQAQGYERFSLGMAPLSGFETSQVAPLWNHLAAFLYRHGERFYNFQGLRAYKEKFHPHWEPRYLVYPGGLRLPRILADIAALVAGGYGRILLK